MKEQIKAWLFKRYWPAEYHRLQYLERNRAWYQAKLNTLWRSPQAESEWQKRFAELDGEYNKLWDTNTRLRAALQTVGQALREFSHAQECGPDWYTKGSQGLYQQTRMWARKGFDALKEVESI